MHGTEFELTARAEPIVLWIGSADLVMKCFRDLVRLIIIIKHEPRILFPHPVELGMEAEKWKLQGKPARNTIQCVISAGTLVCPAEGLWREGALTSNSLHFLRSSRGTAKYRLGVERKAHPSRLCSATSSARARIVSSEYQYWFSRKSSGKVCRKEDCDDAIPAGGKGKGRVGWERAERGFGFRSRAIPCPERPSPQVFRASRESFLFPPMRGEKERKKEKGEKESPTSLPPGGSVQVEEEEKRKLFFPLLSRGCILREWFFPDALSDFGLARRVVKDAREGVCGT